MLKIYGSPASSAGRCFWMLEEAGVPYEHMPLNMRNKEHKSASFLSLNPNGKVPVLVDDDFVLWESMAINNYLAEKYAPSLLPQDIEERARANQWSYWSILELQPPMIDLFIQFVFVPEEKRNLELIEKSKAVLPGKLQIFENHLKQHNFVAGTTFSVADINVATVVAIAPMVKIDLSAYPSLLSWQKRLADRPAYSRFAKMQKPH